MKHKLISTYTALTAAALASCGGEPEASFANFAYYGTDQCHINYEANDSTYCNPILGGYYPDPSVCKRGDTYYLVNSSFAHFPSIPLFKSTDLVHWEQIGHVLTRDSQVNLNGVELSHGIYAPAISYNPHNDTFYVITTCVYCGGNFIVKTQDPEGEWSDPIWLPDVGGIDPSLFFDEDGRAFIVNNDAPQNDTEWEGHRAIWMREYNTETDCTIGNAWVVVDGGVDKSQKPVWIEGPHLYKINGKYMLMAAEGGTGPQHSEVIFTSDKPEGPYTPAAHNPILTQRDLPDCRPDKVTCTGHADLIEDNNGDYWAVFLGCRPYAKGYYNTGRETFLLPVDMSGETPVILPHGSAVPLIATKKGLTCPDDYEPFGGPMTWSCDFSGDELPHRFLFVRNIAEPWYTIADNRLTIKARPVSLDSIANPSMVAYRQQHTSFSAEADVEFSPRTASDFAGLACYQNEKNYIVAGITANGDGNAIAVISCENGKHHTIGTLNIGNATEAKLTVNADRETYTFEACVNGQTTTIATATGYHLSTERAGGFVGTIIGMFATSNLSTK